MRQESHRLRQRAAMTRSETELSVRIAGHAAPLHAVSDESSDIEQRAEKQFLTLKRRRESRSQSCSAPRRRSHCPRRPRCAEGTGATAGRGAPTIARARAPSRTGRPRPGPRRRLSRRLSALRARRGRCGSRTRDGDRWPRVRTTVRTLASLVSRGHGRGQCGHRSMRRAAIRCRRPCGHQRRCHFPNRRRSQRRRGPVLRPSDGSIRIRPRRHGDRRPRTSPDRRRRRFARR